MRRYPAIAIAVAAMPYACGDKKYTMTNVAAAVAILFTNHCADSQNDPRTAASVNVIAGAGDAPFDSSHICQLQPPPSPRASRVTPPKWLLR